MNPSPFHHFAALEAAEKKKITIYTVVSQKDKANPKTVRFVTRYQDKAFDRAETHRKDGDYKVEIFAKAY